MKVITFILLVLIGLAAIQTNQMQQKFQSLKDSASLNAQLYKACTAELMQEQLMHNEPVTTP